MAYRIDLLNRLNLDYHFIFNDQISPEGIYPWNLFVIGMRRSRPNARGVILMPGAA